MPRLRLLLVASCFAVAASACEDGGVGAINGEVEGDTEIDFGDVPVGLMVTKTFELRNKGGTQIQVSAIEPDVTTFSADTYVFEVPREAFTINTGDSKTIEVSFRSFVEMETAVESSLAVRSNVNAHTVRVKGRGISKALLIEPDPAVFGNVLVGSSRTLDVSITNVSSFPLELKTDRAPDGTPQVAITSGTGRFEILATPGPDGSLLGAMTHLEPTQSITVQAKYTPDLVATGRDDRGRWKVSYCAFDYCSQELRLEGRGTASAIECAPPMIDFGAVNPGRIIPRPVVCTNLSTDAVEVTGWSLEGAGAGAYSTSASRVQPLGIGEAVTIDVEFRPTAATPLATPLEATLKVEASTTDARPLTPVNVLLVGSSGGPTISVAPDRLSFGQVAVGTRSTKRLLVANGGYADLLVTRIDPDLAMTGAYSAAPLAFTLAVGTSTIVEVSFEPTVAGDAPSTLVIYSNDSWMPETQVMLTGQGVELAPCSYSLVPNPVTFGAVEVNTSATLGVRFSNTGPEDCLMNDVTIVDDLGGPSPVFNLVNGEETGLVIAPGDARDFPVEYSPLRSGNDRGYLTFYVSDPGNSMPRIPLLGVGEALTEVECPTSVTTLAGTAVPLAINITTRGTSVVSINWMITSGPPGGIGTPNQWTPDPPNTQNETFLPYIPGVYDIHVAVVDDRGTSAGCDFTVTAEGHGLRVSMTWDGSGDVDLHLNNSTTLPWFMNNDCYYGNRAPLWDATQPMSLGPNPELDFDNTSGFGPENTTIDQPVFNQIYTIGVHNFARSAGRITTIDVFCGGVTAPTSTFVSQPLNGSDAGNCTTNDFWRVATVEFTSMTTCIVTPIDTYVLSSVACTTY